MELKKSSDKKVLFFFQTWQNRITFLTLRMPFLMVISSEYIKLLAL